MFGVVIAAGRGSRCGELTESRPKCLLRFAGRPLLVHTLDRLQEAGCSRRVAVLGYRADAVPDLGAARVLNPRWDRCDLLHSLLTARHHLTGPGLVAYGDTWFEPGLAEGLAAAPGDVVLAVDEGWRAAYRDRPGQTEADAEKVWFDPEGRVRSIGKHLGAEASEGLACAEFVGMVKLTGPGSARFVEAFDELEARLRPDEAFAGAARWGRAYATDLIQYLVDQGETVRVHPVDGGWYEVDTAEDYRRRRPLAEVRGLATLAAAPDEPEDSAASSPDPEASRAGARLRSEANDLKRTPEALADELGRDRAEVAAVLAGERGVAAARELAEAMAAAYPVRLARLLVEPDDTLAGVRVVEAGASAASSRIFARADGAGGVAPYYEYRDTAMARHGPFRPEWIAMLREVPGDDPVDPKVIYNRGHLLHQFTLFRGSVDFYYRDERGSHVVRMGTGDACVIPPYVPHSFTRPSGAEESRIVAVTFGLQLYQGLDAVGRVDGEDLEALVGGRENSWEARLARWGALACLDGDDLREALAVRCPGRAGALAGGEPPADLDEVRALAEVLGVDPGAVAGALESGPRRVRLVSYQDAATRSFHGYSVRDLIGAPGVPGLRAFEVRAAAEGAPLRHHFHSYLFHFGGGPVVLGWGDGYEVLLGPEESAYLAPLTPHVLTGDPDARLLVVRVQGELGEAVLEEYVGYDAQGRARAGRDRTRWF